ncbi:hypothetical protein PENTCL1PPCAC_5166, partial [Pristionchus entomophagus]
YLTRAIFTGIQDGNFTNHHFRGIAMGNPGMDIWLHTRKLSALMQMFAMGMLPQRVGPALFRHWVELGDGDLHLPTIGELKNKTIYNLNVMCEDTGNEELEPKIWHIERPRRESECTAFEAANGYCNREDV